MLACGLIHLLCAALSSALLACESSHHHLLALRKEKLQPQNQQLPKSGSACISPNNAADGPWHAVAFASLSGSRPSTHDLQSVILSRSRGTTEMFKQSRQSRDRSHLLKQLTSASETHVPFTRSEIYRARMILSPDSSGFPIVPHRCRNKRQRHGSTHG